MTVAPDHSAPAADAAPEPAAADAPAGPASVSADGLPDTVPLPPWLAFPESDPWWPGWRDGAAEGWMRTHWLPWWRALDAATRADFIRANPPPDEAWLPYLRHHWR